MRSYLALHYLHVIKEIVMRIVLCSFALFLSTVSCAQNTWQLNEVAVGLGTQNDRIHKMSMDWMRTYSRSNEAFDVQLDGFEYNPYSEFLGTALNLDVTFAQPELSADVSHEFRIGARFVTDREAMIEYSREEFRDEGTYHETMIFCLVDDEFVGEVGYLIRKTKSHFSVYTGISGALGTTFSSQLLRIRNASLSPDDNALNSTASSEVESTTETFAARNALFYRFQVPIGVEFHRNKWAFGPEFRIGAGGHSIYGGKSYLILPTTSFSFRLSYFPKR